MVGRLGTWMPPLDTAKSGPYAFAIAPCNVTNPDDVAAADPAIARRDLGALGDLVECTRVVRFERPRSLSQLRASADFVAAALRGVTP